MLPPTVAMACNALEHNRSCFGPKTVIGQIASGITDDRFLMLNRDEPSRALRGFVSNRRSDQVTDSESTSILVASVVAAT
jgi:hypothetical protein